MTPCNVTELGQNNRQTATDTDMYTGARPFGVFHGAEGGVCY